MTNEYIEGFAQRKAELEAEKSILENKDIEIVVNEEFDKIKEEIRAKVLKEHEEKIADKTIEIEAIDRLIAREVAKLEAEQAIVSEEVPDGQEGVEA